MSLKTYSQFTNKLNILYVHGLNSSANSKTATRLHESLKSKLPSFNWFAPLIPTEVEEGILFIEKFVNENNIGLVIGSSLGGFKVLNSYLPQTKRVVINPLISLSTLKDDFSVNETLADSLPFFRLIDKKINRFSPLRIDNNLVGIFSTEDELIESDLSVSLFKKYLGLNKNPLSINLIDDTHRPQKISTIANIVVESLSNFNNGVEKYNEEWLSDLTIPFNINESFEKEFNNLKFLNETFINLFEPQDKSKYIKEIAELLKITYAKIGGPGGKMNWKEGELEADVLENDMFKLWRVGGKIIGGSTYKFKRGRKLNSIFHDGSQEGIRVVKKILWDDFKMKDRNVYSEVSGKPQEILAKNEFAIPLPSKFASELLKKDVQIVDEWWYIRNIGGNPHKKMIYIADPKILNSLNLNQK